MRLSEFDYDLPETAIAQSPAEPRDSSRLLVLNKDTGAVTHANFRNLPEFLAPGDLLVRNNTRVTALRLLGRKPTGAAVEALLLRPLGDGLYEALVRPGRRLLPGSQIDFDGGLSALVISKTDSGGRVLDFGGVADLSSRLEQTGSVPLPPYFQSQLDDPERYQTIYASRGGSSAAPTAGLHFTRGTFEGLSAKEVGLCEITLDVGVDTFRPIKTDDISQHQMHGESYFIPSETAKAVAASQARIVAVGTTATRALETAALSHRTLRVGEGCTSLFITPGYKLQVIDAMLTNFHMPRTTMMLLVSALCGRDNLMTAYQEALDSGYRFLSFGDSMLVIGETNEKERV